MSVKRPYYLATIDYKPFKGKRYSIENNALWEARAMVKASGKTVLVMRDGVVVREILPVSLSDALNNEIAATERKLIRLKQERQIRCYHCYAIAKRVDCTRCTRSMCVECIGVDNLCGLCHDETELGRT